MSVLHVLYDKRDSDVRLDEAEGRYRTVDIEHASPRQSYASNVAWKRLSSRTGTAYRAWENNLEPHHDISTVTGKRWRRE